MVTAGMPAGGGGWPSERRRVVVTGLGAVTAAGRGMGALWSALREGRVGVTVAEGVAAGRVADGWLEPLGVPAWLLGSLDRASQLGLAAALEAQADARSEFSPQNAFAAGIVTGTAHSGGEGWAALGSGLSGASLGLNMAGPVLTVGMGGASGLGAVAVAAQMIRAGVVRAALAVGAEAPLRADVRAAYQQAGLLNEAADAHGQRPFDAARQGIVLGEGAGALMLEDRQLAVQRGVPIYAEVGGEAMTAGPIGDGQPPTDVEVARRAVNEALLGGEVLPQDVDVIVASGAGTQAGDERETDIVERAFGRRTLDMYAAAVSPNAGWTAGAAGALSAAAGAMIVREKEIPPHATLAEQDAACGLGLVRRVYADQIGGAAVLAFGSHGQNACVVLVPHTASLGDEVALL